jgi:hypothetical protein
MECGGMDGMDMGYNIIYYEIIVMQTKHHLRVQYHYHGGQQQQLQQNVV